MQNCKHCEKRFDCCDELEDHTRECHTDLHHAKPMVFDNSEHRLLLEQISGEQCKGGYDVPNLGHVSPELKCPHCEKLLRQAVQTEGGIRLCRTCHSEILVTPGLNLPSEIAVDPSENVFPDRAVMREIQSLLVKCMHHLYGCPWEDHLQYWEEHCEKCPWRLAKKCSNEGCDKYFPTIELDGHVENECSFRSVTCDYCFKEILANQLEVHHVRCPQFPVTCDRCWKEIPRVEMEDHQMQECPFLDCPVCTRKVSRETSQETSPEGDGQLHLANPQTIFQHMQQLTQQENRLSKELTETRAMQQQAERGIADRRKATLEFEANHQDIKDSLEQFSQRVTSVEAQLRRGAQDPTVSVGNLEKTMQQQDSRIRDLEQQVERLSRSLLPQSQLTDAESWPIQEVESREIQLKRKVEKLEQQIATMEARVCELKKQRASSYDGVLLWRVPEVSRHRRDQLFTSIYSPPFYTDRNGYKMCIRAYLNGDGIGYKTHLSIFFVLMKGEFDPLLKWPFNYKVSLILLDQNRHSHIVRTFRPLPESSSFQQPRSDMNVASGCPQFVELSVLDDENYVKEDVLYIKCIVDTPSL